MLSAVVYVPPTELFARLVAIELSFTFGVLEHCYAQSKPGSGCLALRLEEGRDCR